MLEYPDKDNKKSSLEEKQKITFILKKFFQKSLSLFLALLFFVYPGIHGYDMHQRSHVADMHIRNVKQMQVEAYTRAIENYISSYLSEQLSLLLESSALAQY
jgi:hypothetical protein